ncbi:MAG TPA: phosphoribosyltransferase [Moorella mulderi]|nr:phosphoribosyltransferase [Moorella mulderi]
MLFKDRLEAGRRLAERLALYKDSHPIILAIPRGGVVVAEPVAEALGGELDLVIPRKVGLPANPELAVAAVAPDGTVLYNMEVMEALRLSPEDIWPLVEQERLEIKRRLKAYRGREDLPPLKDRTVIVVDDGVATGLTTAAAVEYVKKAPPQRVILAVPVAPPDTAAWLRSKVDELICLYTPEPFYAVGQFYLDFRQITDEEVKEILSRFQKRKPS